MSKPVTIEEARKTNIFNRLHHVNLLLTNKCTLKCKYCFEQHDTDFGEFTPDSIKKVYDFLLNVNDLEAQKVIQFFGGEPLLQKDLILDFIEEYRDVLEMNKNSVRLSMVTNGSLLDSKFIRKYLHSNEFTSMLISIDTLEEEGDHRCLSTMHKENIFRAIESCSDSVLASGRVGLRTTISPETAPNLIDFAETMYFHGIRQMVIHPITYSRTQAFVEWPEQAWYNMEIDIKYLMSEYPDFRISFVEGIGQKGGSNCMIGTEMIAVDPSGEFSGCYFFNNLKAALPQTTLGNVFTDEINIEAYQTYHKTYLDLFKDNADCQDCDLSNLCFQCPAGNMGVFGEVFRSDSMCKRVVKLHLSIQEFNNANQFENFMNKLLFEMDADPVKLKHRLVQCFRKINSPHVNIVDDPFTDEELENIGERVLLVALDRIIGMRNSVSHQSTIINLRTLLSEITIADDYDIKEIYKYIGENYTDGKYPNLEDICGENDVAKGIYVIAFMYLNLFKNWFDRTDKTEELKFD